MKTISILLGLLYSLNSLACFPEAQFSGNISKIILESDYCTIFIKKFDYYKESQICGLNKSHVKQNGIYFPKNRCRFQINDSLSGILVKNKKYIYLD
ncbi:MAG: hypothetical protein QF441_04315 [Bacteriovoracaceae bacterium]|jgi:hypothetical protein|nr:hypothetical protein [Halobacteriovoraceae bacterium]MDP7319805.1 hypothetical protein [Bacteriovoracaceae bacterium]|tara:strand:- start:97 stop:387 length:291 start_codon:yes stop_codon:yes gene_type:complete